MKSRIYIKYKMLFGMPTAYRVGTAYLNRYFLHWFWFNEAIFAGG